MSNSIPIGYNQTPIFEEHFDGNALDTSKWAVAYGANYKIENSNLVLGPGGVAIRGRKSDGTVLFDFQYGYIEFKAKMAGNNGINSYRNGLWFVTPPSVSFPLRAEIDITETSTGALSHDMTNWVGINKMNIHYHRNAKTDGSYVENFGKKFDCNVDLSKEYHLYACEWTPDFLRFLFDNQEVYKITKGQATITDQRMYIWAGDLCARPNTTDPSKCWPCTVPANTSQIASKMYVDYVKIYQKSTEPINLILNAKFEEGEGPKYWRNYQTGMEQIYTYPEIGRSGGFCVAIEYKTREEGKMAAWVQDLQIDNTKNYKLSGWIKTQNIVGRGGALRIYWKDQNGKYISSSEIMPRQSGTIDWTYFDGTLTPYVGSARATIALELYDCSGKVWFDEVLFGQI